MISFNGPLVYLIKLKNYYYRNVNGFCCHKVLLNTKLRLLIYFVTIFHEQKDKFSKYIQASI